MSSAALALPAALAPEALALAIAGALVAGFTSGFAGFGTGLVASGIWYHALAPGMVPFLIAVTSVAAQLVALFTISHKPTIRGALPMLAGGLIGLPLGIVALAAASPAGLKGAVGVFLIAYVVAQFAGLGRARIGDWGGRRAEVVVGGGGGFLAGFCGLSGPIPIIWLQLRGGPAAEQRAIYQPFNLVILTLASLGMIAAGSVGHEALLVTAFCLPATLVGAWGGARAYGLVGEAVFKRVVLTLLLGSGLILVAQVLAR